MLNPVPLTVPLAASVVNEPLPGEVVPILPGEFQVPPSSVAALTLVLQLNPVPLVY
ncbi:hypothetical protein [Paraburkholderia youngii]|uniref:hypothetical protein n=1 Tax=Paraburkholderia youngii TaxID=2782701 RepID=UPI0015932FC5|nr:hypothetical protein [Paraburkholderia youngii]